MCCTTCIFTLKYHFFLYQNARKLLFTYIFLLFASKHPQNDQQIIKPLTLIRPLILTKKYTNDIKAYSLRNLTKNKDNSKIS